MAVITIGGKEYTLEYTFEAAACKELVNKMFNVMAGTYFISTTNETSDNENVNQLMSTLGGISAMVADIPAITKIAFYAGLLEHHNFTEDEAYALQKQYMKETKKSFKDLNDEIQTYMVDDGFFDLAGLTATLTQLATAITEPDQKKPKNSRKLTTV